jgi:mRNA interferase HicA
MKRTEIEKKLHKLGWYLKRHGGNHDIWTNGEMFEPVPRHPEIAEMFAKKIMKKALQNPCHKEKN